LPTGIHGHVGLEPAKHKYEDIEMIKKTIIAVALTTTFATTAGAAVVSTDTLQKPYQTTVTNAERDHSLAVSKIKRAAKQACGTFHRTDAGSLTQVMKNRACYNEALESAMAKAGLKTTAHS
tara:strand:- start:5305 stop:5670 length:366 start_codon:yes stop_codon:yes gene_type:complete